MTVLRRSVIAIALQAVGSILLGRLIVGPANAAPNGRFTRKTYLEAKDSIPKDTWVYKRGESNEGLYDDHFVIVHDGDLHLPSLDLDNLSRSLGLNEDDERKSYLNFVLLVRGDLLVDDYIVNLDTDGSTNLIVLGDLKAKNIAVGGQDIYVQGALTVEELFWGDNSHGELIVKGRFSAALLIDTDEYSVVIHEMTRSQRRLSNWGASGRHRTLHASDFEKDFDPELILVTEEDGSFLKRKELIGRLRAGEFVIRGARPAPASRKP